jgi:perosamine synthetase
MASLIQRAIGKARRLTVRRMASVGPSLRVAIIGYGGIGPDHAEAYEATVMCNLVAVSDVNTSALAGALRRRPYLRVFRDYRQMLDEVKPDMVSVCTWPQTHAEIVKAVAESGAKGILCEKPLTLRLDELEEMAELCAKYKVKLAGGHQWRFHPYFRRAAELVKRGALGTGVHVTASCLGVLADNGPHLIDSIRFILGDRRALSVKCRAKRESNLIRQGMPAEDGAECEIEFEGGVRASFVSGSLAERHFILIEGSNGTVEVTRDALKTTGGIEAGPSINLADVYPDQFRQLARWVKGRVSTCPISFENVAPSTEIMLALYDSARVGESVPLPLKNKGNIIAQLYPAGEAANLAEPVAVVIDKRPLGERLAMDGGSRVVPKWFDSGPRVGLPEALNLAKVIISRNMNCTEGQMVNRFQQEYADLLGARYATASSSGTAAIHCALGALSLNPGDEVITTPFTDMGTVIPILACNCLPIFADVDPLTGNLTAETILRKITSKTKAVILVHLFGRPADLDPICEVLRVRGIRLIEDCAQAHFAEYKGRKVGTIGDFGCFSFQQSKQISCGDGGITISNNEDLAMRAALFSDKGWQRSSAGRAGRNHYFLGMNYRMTEFQGAVALAQTRRLPGLIAARRAAAGRLAAQLRNVPGIILPPQPQGVNPSWWVFSFTTDQAGTGVTNKALSGALNVEGVSVATNYLTQPLFEYDVIKLQKTYGESRYPFSEYPWEVPKSEDYTGFHQANANLGIFWSHNVQNEHVDGIAKAVQKVMTQQKH